MLLSDLDDTVDKCFSSEILYSMQDDEISKVACNDWLIRQLGYSVYEKHGSSQKKRYFADHENHVEISFVCPAGHWQPSHTGRCHFSR